MGHHCPHCRRCVYRRTTILGLAITLFVAGCGGLRPERPGEVDRAISGEVTFKVQSCLASRGLDEVEIRIEVDRTKVLISSFVNLSGSNAIDSLNECLDQAGVVTLEAHP